MIALITEIIEKFGPRPAGSDAEKQAQLFIKAKCEEFTNKVQFLPFQEHLRARFGKLKYYVVIYIAALLLYNYLPVVALIIALVNAFFVISDLMMYRDVLTQFPGAKETSSNVEAVLEPRIIAKSTLIISAHMDSAHEYRWWYKLGGLGVRLTVLAGVLMVMLPVFLAWHIFLPSHFHFYIWLFFVALTPVTIVFWSMEEEHTVPGAQDNLSGIAIAYEAFKHFSDKNENGKSILETTRIKFVSFGSEERGLCGSRMYVRQKKEELKSENAFLINIDGVRLVKEISIVKRELMNGTSYNPKLISGLQQSFQRLNLSYKMITIPIGGTDGVSFARAGLPAVSIIGMSTTEYDFTYHTRHDVVANIEPQALEHVKSGIIEFVTKWDETSV